MLMKSHSNVEYVVRVLHKLTTVTTISRSTIVPFYSCKKFILAKTLTVKFVERSLHKRVILNATAEFIPMRNYLSAKCVEKDSQEKAPSMHIQKPILMKRPLTVKYVEMDLQQAIL